MKIHELKTDSEVFRAVLNGLKTYEIRRNDRDFATGDKLLLRETRHTGAEMARGEPLEYTGLEIEATITHMLTGPIYGLDDGWSILSLSRHYPKCKDCRWWFSLPWTTDPETRLCLLEEGSVETMGIDHSGPEDGCIHWEGKG